MIHLPSHFNESVFIGMGSNLGDRNKNLQEALNCISQHPSLKITKCSSIIETAPWGETAQPLFLNAVVEVTTSFSPKELLVLLKQWEQQLGRIPSKRWGPRLIDMDILLFGQRIVSCEFLVIPHAELKNRTFVLQSLLEIDPELKHPECHEYIRSYLPTPY